jgi:hypothetical protein
MKPRRVASRILPPAPPTVPELVDSPELAAVMLLEHALDVAVDALLAEHMTLIDDFRRPSEDGPVLSLANTICRRAPALRDALRRYRKAVRLATSSDADTADADIDDRTF